MPDFDVSSDRLSALPPESPARSRPSQSDSSYPLQYRGKNRLLGLEAELRQKQQAIRDTNPSPTPPLQGEGLSDSPFPPREGGWSSTNRQNFSAAQPANPPQYQPRGRNRWLELERELQSRCQNNILPPSDRTPIPAPPSPTPAIQRQVFDHNEPIYLQYPFSSFPRADPASDRAPPLPEIPAISDPWDVAKSLDEGKPEAITPPPEEQQPPALPDTKKPSAPKFPTLEELATALLEIINHPKRPPVEVSTSSVSPSPPQPEINANSHNTVSQQMGIDLPYATEFDLGTIELEQLFDSFDRQIEQTKPAEVVDLKQRFEEFDRALDAQQSDSKVKPKSANQTKRSGLGFAPKKR